MARALGNHHWQAEADGWLALLVTATVADKNVPISIEGEAMTVSALGQLFSRAALHEHVHAEYGCSEPLVPVLTFVLQRPVGVSCLESSRLTARRSACMINMAAATPQSLGAKNKTGDSR